MYLETTKLNKKQSREIDFLFTHSWPSAQPVMVQQVFLPSDIIVSTTTLLLLLPSQQKPQL